MDLQPIVNNVVAVVVGVITLVGILAPFILPFVRKIQNENLRKTAEEWVGYAEQISEAGMKKGEPAMAGELKFKIAADGLKKATGVSDEKAQILIESVLGAAKILGYK